MKDDYSESPTRRKASIKNYVSRVCKESSVSVVSAFVSTRSVPRKGFLVLVFVLFTAAFLYQIIKFLSYVYTYPTMVNIEITKPDFYLTPAYTFCNYNTIKRSKFCHKYPEKCINPEEKFCKKYSFYCGENETKVPIEEYFLKENYPSEEIFDLGHDVDSFLKSKTVERNEEASGPFLRIRNKETNDLSLCYSFHSRVNSSLEPLMTERQTWMKEPQHTFEFDPEEWEVFSPNDRPGMIFEVHSPFVAVNPFDKGIFLKPGYSYRITISMQEEKLLPYPYKTDCVNYTALKQQRRTSIAKEDINDSPCLDNSTVQYEEVEKLFDNCSKKCKDDCLLMKYTYQVSEFYRVPEWTKRDNNKESRLIKVEINIEDSEIIALYYSPQYQEVEVFSYIGGFIGIWLGVSLVQIVDVFESLFRIARYFCKKGGPVCRRESTTLRNVVV